MPQVAQPVQDYTRRRKFLKTLMVAVVVSFLLGGVGYAGWRYYTAHFPDPTVGKEPF